MLRVQIVHIVLSALTMHWLQDTFNKRGRTRVRERSRTHMHERERERASQPLIEISLIDSYKNVK